ncbi:aminoacyl-tRNA hydrolase [Frigoriglobus tundricola]|uniref:Peptidyl-tRNA hydrolase n=1 Tax=Frigoriglobus tundricola TaxID=2774151 RepID=A0A6M5YMU9_9BACT|nr:aminoacyl-tRNA hydrolase [Frigoriglobus tundricola]QJW94262.1 Peptidyl-tRNA hydrolase [Frigoriglobus tundricola]
MKLIVGLGNPGPKYAGTRHNVGFDVIDYLAAAPGCTPFREKFEALVAEVKEGDETVLLVKPLTFMNLSGRAVRAIADFYKVPVEGLLVVCDDLNLPLGKLRIRIKGSHGGQNGLRNIQEQLGTDAYTRLRLGVGQPAFDAVDHVLSKFKAGERATVEEAIATAAQAALLWTRRGAEAAMNQFNGGDEKEKPKKEKKPRPDDKKADASDKPTL